MKPEHTKPFNLEHAKAGAPYAQKSDLPARIGIWDSSSQPVVNNLLTQLLDSVDGSCYMGKEWELTTCQSLRKASPDYEALKAENERLIGCLSTANANAEKFEREWYLRGDENEALKGKYEGALESIREHQQAGIALKARVTELEAATYHLGLTPQQAKDGLARYKADLAERDKLQMDAARWDYVMRTTTAIHDSGEVLSCTPEEYKAAVDLAIKLEQAK